MLVTTYQSFGYQQSLADREVGIVGLLEMNWANTRKKSESIAVAIDSVYPGGVSEVSMRDG